MIPIRRLAELDDRALDRLLVRGRAGDPDVAATVSELLAEIRTSGDDALRAQTLLFDAVALADLEVPGALWERALAALDDELKAALEAAAAAIRRFHVTQLPAPTELEVAPGLVLGRRPDPLRRVGVYAPGGRASYPSSVLMGVVPARVAGVDEVIVCSPPGPDGLPSPLVMAACAVAGADRLFALGGTAAIGALAHGTETVPRVDRIVGPGNAWVMEAKLQVSAVTGIDSPAGPSELLVLADGSADPDVIAIEMIAQAEHDPDAAVVLITTDEGVARGTLAALDGLVADTPRRDIVEASIRASGAVLVVDSVAEAVGFAERYAPEHLLLLTERPRATLRDVRAAGTVFLGPRSSVVFGDYATGANHVLPTGGLARSYSGLSTTDFVRWTTWQEVRDDDAAAALAGAAAPLADAEGLPGHAAAARRAGAFDPPPALARTGLGAARVSPRRPYRSMERYDPRRPALELDLSANTNLWGSCSAALEALAEGPPLAAYPAIYADELGTAIADRWSVRPAEVVTGCGSDDLIDSTIRAFCDPGSRVAYPSPTFPMAETFALMNDVVPCPVALDPDGGLSDGAMAELATANLVYLCRPNNPTGDLLSRASVAELLGRARGLVLIDEAYSEYAGESVLDLALESGRGVVLRTFSKAYGLAALRVGYAIGPERLVRAIELSRGPYKVSGPGERAATAAIRDGGEWVQQVVADTIENRGRLSDALRGRGLGVRESAANFLLVGVAAGTAAGLKAALAERGVGVRAFDEADAIRVTVGPWPAMARFLDALDDVLARRFEWDRGAAPAEPADLEVLP